MFNSKPKSLAICLSCFTWMALFFIAPIAVYPGEMEQEAMALPALRALRGELKPHVYSGRDVWQGFGYIGL